MVASRRRTSRVIDVAVAALGGFALGFAALIMPPEMLAMVGLAAAGLRARLILGTLFGFAAGLAILRLLRWLDDFGRTPPDRGTRAPESEPARTPFSAARELGEPESAPNLPSHWGAWLPESSSAAAVAPERGAAVAEMMERLESRLGRRYAGLIDGLGFPVTPDEFDAPELPEARLSRAIERLHLFVGGVADPPLFPFEIAVLPE